MFLKTLRLRVKDKHAPVLRRMAREVNTVWNYVNDLSYRSIRDRGVWMSGYDLQKYIAGYTRAEDISILSMTANAVCDEYASRRRQHRKNRLRWRVSSRTSSKYSLGWVPFKKGTLRFCNGRILYAGNKFALWDSYGLANYDLRSGSFSEDSRGRWYFNILAEVSVPPSLGKGAIGVDLGLKTAATASDGSVADSRFYRTSEARLAIAQRAGKKRQTRAILAKIANQRKDGLHKFSARIVKENAAIFIGDVKSKSFVKGRFAKSAHDAGWGMLKIMLEYKSRQAGIIFAEVDERYSTQTCSHCGSIEGPKGFAGLSKREWQCGCGAILDRDVNAAANIRRVGLDTLLAGAVIRTEQSNPLPVDLRKTQP